MARKKELYLKDARDALCQALNILATGEEDLHQLPEIKAAAKQAEQAAAALNQLAGVMDTESDLPKREPTRSSRIGPDRYRS